MSEPTHLAYTQAWKTQPVESYAAAARTWSSCCKHTQSALDAVAAIALHAAYSDGKPRLDQAAPVLLDALGIMGHPVANQDEALDAIEVILWRSTVLNERRRKVIGPARQAAGEKASTARNRRKRGK